MPIRIKLIKLGKTQQGAQDAGSIPFMYSLHLYAIDNI